jgi:hypothetical protein
MSHKSNKEQFISEAFSYYKSLGKIRCPILKNQLVVFGNSGFSHLLRKGRKTRPFNETYRKIKLLTHIPFVLADKRTRMEKTISLNRIYGIITYFGLTNSADIPKIRIILRRYGSGTIHFVSIMSL